MAEFQDLITAAIDYYGYDPLKKAYEGELTYQEAQELLRNNPKVKTVTDKRGNVLWRTYEAEVEKIVGGGTISDNIGAAPDSNKLPTQTVTKVKHKFNVPVYMEPAETAGKFTIRSGAKAVGKAASKANVIVGAATTAYEGASIIMKLGKKLEKKLYDINPDWWDSHGLETMNPDIWGDIINRDTVGDKILRFIFQIEKKTDSTGEESTVLTNYIEEDIFAYITKYLTSKDVFKPDTWEISVPDVSGLHSPLSRYKDILDNSVFRMTANTTLFTLNKDEYINKKYPMSDVRPPTGTVTATLDKDIDNGIGIYLKYRTDKDGPDRERLVIFSKKRFDLEYFGPHLSYNPDTGGFVPSSETYIGSTTASKWELDNGMFAYVLDIPLSSKYTRGIPYDTVTPSVYTPNTWSHGNITDPVGFLRGGILYDLIYIYNKGVYKLRELVKGIQTNTNATKVFDGSNISDFKNTDLTQTKQELKKQFPELWDDALTVRDGDNETTFLPVPSVPNDISDEQPTTGETIKDEYTPDTAPKDQTESSSKEDTKQDTEDTGKGDTPSVILPSGATQGLWAIYNPTQAQLKMFGAWLWADDFVEQIKKIFADPMQAIIGLHKVYCGVPTSGTQNIQVGYLDSGVSSAVVSQQYVTVDCGSVNLPEYFGNVLDYPPYTKISLYLPFVGIVDLSGDYVLRSTISIKYGIDVLTGACLVMVNITRDNAGGVLYQYSGNCAVTYPISSGSYMGVMSGVLGIAGAVAGVVSGGSLLPAVGAGIAGIMNAKTNVQHSGSFSGNAGAMGSKIPYLIISRPQAVIADDVEKIKGLSANQSDIIGKFNGFTKFNKVNVKDINATSNELALIEAQLLEGVYL